NEPDRKSHSPRNDLSPGSTRMDSAERPQVARTLCGPVCSRTIWGKCSEMGLGSFGNTRCGRMGRVREQCDGGTLITAIESTPSDFSCEWEILCFLDNK